MSRHFSIWVVVLATAAAFMLGPAAPASELDGIVKPCGPNQICAWFKTRAKPPKGWAIDEDWTTQYEAVVMFKGGDKSKTAPMMYVRTHMVQTDSQSVEDYAKGAQERWLEKVKDSIIEPQPDIARAGKAAFKVFLYKNPSVPEQAFELTAFTKDTDPAHENATYFQQVVLVAPSLKTLERARAAFEDLLKRL